MDNNKLLTVLTIILLSVNVLGASIIEAESFFKAGKSFYEEDDWENCLRNIERSKEIFVELKDTRGIQKTQEYISTQLDQMLTEAQMAQLYYDLSGDYYVQSGPEDLEALERGYYLSEECKRRYGLISGKTGSSGVLKCEDLSSQINKKIVGIKNSKLVVARVFYERSQLAYRVDDLVAARELVLNASYIYNQIPDSTGISKTAALITSIETRIQDIKVNAATAYKRSLDLTVSNDWKQAKEYAISSQNLYSDIGDEEGYTKSSQLLNRINNELSFNREERLRQARSYFLEAQEAYTLQQFTNATLYANEAKFIYKQFLDEAEIEEESLPPQKKVQVILFMDKIASVNKLIAQIYEDYGYERILEQAESLYSRSQEYYTLNRLGDAKAYARNAYSMYEELGYHIGMAKTQSLLTTIVNREELMHEAAKLLTSARSFYNTADFENAYYQVTKSKQLYQDLWMTKKVELIDGMIENISKARSLKSQADDSFSKAQGHYNAMNYREALEYSQNSNRIYTLVNYTLGVQESQKVMDEVSDILHDEYIRFRNTILALVAVAIVILFVLVSWRKRGEQMENEFIQRKRTDEEHRRRDEEAWGLEKEEETKGLVEDELKKLIQEERRLTDDD